MAIAVRENTVYAVEIEDTEGTYKAPTSSSSYVLTLEDGAEFSPEKELLERSVFNGSLGKTTPRTGMRQVSGALPVEMRASSTEGSAPEYDALMRSALGLRRQVSATTADNSDTGTTPEAHTTTRIYLADSDGDKYNVGDVVTVKKTGAYHTSPVVEVSDAAGDSYIDLLIAADSAFENGDVIAAVTTYATANSGHPSLSISKYMEEARLEQASGCKVTTLELSGFETGQLASFNFGFEGLDWDTSLTPQPHTPVYDTALPPIILSACVYQNGQKIDVNSFSFNLDNELGFATSTCAANGRFSARPTSRTITGTMNPYKNDDDVDQMTNFKNNVEFSLSATAYIPDSEEDGEYGQVVSIYMPNCIITEIGEEDADGLLQESLTFQATRGQDATQEELYISVS